MCVHECEHAYVHKSKCYCLVEDGDMTIALCLYQKREREFWIHLIIFLLIKHLLAGLVLEGFHSYPGFLSLKIFQKLFSLKCELCLGFEALFHPALCVCLHECEHSYVHEYLLVCTQERKSIFENFLWLFL